MGRRRIIAERINVDSPLTAEGYGQILAIIPFGITDMPNGPRSVCGEARYLRQIRFQRPDVRLRRLPACLFNGSPFKIPLKLTNFLLRKHREELFSHDLGCCLEQLRVRYRVTACL